MDAHGILVRIRLAKAAAMKEGYFACAYGMYGRGHFMPYLPGTMAHTWFMMGYNRALRGITLGTMP